MKGTSTFSNDGAFAGYCDGCTSIDAVLVNDIALRLFVKPVYLNFLVDSADQFSLLLNGNPSPKLVFL